MKIDWAPMIRQLVGDVTRRQWRGITPARFHNPLRPLINIAADNIGEQEGVLTNACLRKPYLKRRTVGRSSDGTSTLGREQRIQPSDDGIAFGQALTASWRC